MKIKNNKEEINHYLNKITTISNLYNLKELNIGFDRLEKEEKVDYELLYFKNNNNEEKGVFIFSYDFYIKELKDQEIKKDLGHNSLNFRIHNAYSKLKKSNNTVSINEIINSLTKKDTTLSRNKILTRLMSLAYHHGWQLNSDKKAIDTDYMITIPDNFRNKIKQRFNLDIFFKLVENAKIFFFINLKGDLIFVLKNYKEFSVKDIETEIIPYLQNEFNITKINLNK